MLKAKMVRPSLESLRAAVAGGPPFAAGLLAALRADDRAGAQALLCGVRASAGPVERRRRAYAAHA